ncbi:MAG TPA: uroporphyrinogen decarboxylase [Geobacterales bacterium]|nr:uroporphyrinogen decarboxylase [Geobacterales bacterium]
MNTTFLDACFKKETEYTPIWFMRQAGRYLPLYRKIKGNRTVEELSKDTEAVSEIVSKSAFFLGVDAAIIYTDIIFIAGPMGVKYKIEENWGPVVQNPITSLESVDDLRTFNPEEDLYFIFEGIDKTLSKLNDEIPLIGFSGAPFTLASYLIESKASRSLNKTKVFMLSESTGWNLLMEKLTNVIIRYLEAQIKHGVKAIQLFDSWAGVLSENEYRKYVQKYTKKIFESLPSNVPKIHYCENSYHLLTSIAETGPHVISVDWRVPINHVWERLNERTAVQGNLDPSFVVVGGDEMLYKAEEILRLASKYKGHIFNLGHGILPETPPENLRMLVSYVHEKTRRER